MGKPLECVSSMMDRPASTQPCIALPLPRVAAKRQGDAAGAVAAAVPKKSAVAVRKFAITARLAKYWAVSPLGTQFA
jgi:hypothetical protein